VRWGIAVMPLSQTGIEKRRKFSKVKKKACCGAGN